MGFEVELIDRDRTSLITLTFPTIEQARAFAKCSVLAMRIKAALILSFGDKYEGYELGEDGKPVWLVF